MGPVQALRTPAPSQARRDVRTALHALAPSQGGAAESGCPQRALDPWVAVTPFTFTTLRQAWETDGRDSQPVVPQPRCMPLGHVASKRAAAGVSVNGDVEERDDGGGFAHMSHNGQGGPCAG